MRALLMLGTAPEASGSGHREQGYRGRKAGQAPIQQQQRLKVLPQQGSSLVQHGDCRAAGAALAGGGGGSGGGGSKLRLAEAAHPIVAAI